MPSPNIIAASLARSTANCAVVVLGNSIALYNPPIRVAEEFAMLDVISGGRLVAGFPVGSSMDTNYCYGATPATLRDKYVEAHNLIIKAWTETEPFHFNGKYTQLRYVTPGQADPEAAPAGGGARRGQHRDVEGGHRTGLHVLLPELLRLQARRAGPRRLLDTVDELGVERNPYRAGFLQLVAVANSEAEAEELYWPTPSTSTTSACTSRRSSPRPPAIGPSPQSRRGSNRSSPRRLGTSARS